MLTPMLLLKEMYGGEGKVLLNVQYQGEVMELEVKDDVLRVAVEDKDTPNTPEWHAEYFFIKGNEEGYYKIKTDPETNEGILSVIKVKFRFSTDFDNRTISDQDLYVCSRGRITKPRLLSPWRWGSKTKNRCGFVKEKPPAGWPKTFTTRPSS